MLTGLSADNDQTVREIAGIVCLGVDVLFKRIAQIHALPYSAAESLRADYLRLMISAFQTRVQGRPLGQDSRDANSSLKRKFGDALASKWGPYDTCDRCIARCLYRAAAVVVLDNATVASVNRVVERKSVSKSESDYWQAVSERLASAAAGFETSPAARERLKLCLAVHFARHLGYSGAAQRDFIERATA